MSKKNSRNSILKKASNDSSLTETFSKADRRISFSKKHSIKEFKAGDDKATIWGPSYEESASLIDLNISENPPVISEPQIIFPKQIPFKSAGMTLRNRKLIVPSDLKKKNIVAVEEEKENVNTLPVVMPIENTEISKLKENYDSTPIEPTDPKNIFQKDIYSISPTYNSTINRTPNASWEPNCSLDVTLSEYEKKLFFKDKKNTEKFQSPSPVKENRELKNSQGAKKNITELRTTISTLKGFHVPANSQGAIKKITDQNSISKQKRTKLGSPVNEDENDVYWDCMDMPEEILKETQDNIRKTIHFNETIQDKNVLPKNHGGVGLKPDQKRHTMHMDVEMEMSFNKAILDSTQKTAINLKESETTTNSSHQNQMAVKRKQTIIFENDKSLEISMDSTFQENENKNVDESPLQVMCYIVSNASSFLDVQNENKYEISMELEDSNNFKSTSINESLDRHSNTISNDRTNINNDENNAKQYLNKKQQTILYDKEEKLDTSPVTTEIKSRKTFLDISKNMSQFQSDILSQYGSADLGLSVLPSLSPNPNITNNESLSESFMILDSSSRLNEKENLLKDKIVVSEPIKDLRPRKFSETLHLKINKSRIIERHAVLQEKTEMSISDDLECIAQTPANTNKIDKYYKPEVEAGINIKRKTIMFENNDIELENRSQNVSLNRIESDPKRHTAFNQRSSEMDVSNISEEQSQHPVVTGNRGLQKNRQTNIFLENNELDTTNSCTNKYLHRNEADPKRHTVYNQRSNEMDVTNIFEKQSQHPVVGDNRGLQKNRQTIIFQENNELDTTNSCTNRNESDPKRHTVFNQRSSEMDVTNISEEQLQHPVVGGNRGMTKNRQTNIFLENNELDTTNSCANRNESDPKRHIAFNQRSSEMNVTNISEEQSQHPVVAGNSGLQKNRQTNIFLENNELDTTNTSTNEYLYSNESVPKRHTVFNQRSSEMDVTNISEEQSQHPVPAGNRCLQKNRQTKIFQENNELDTTNSCTNRNESDPKRHTVFNQRSSEMDVINISEEESQHPVVDGNRGLQKNRQTKIFLENNELDTTNTSTNEYLHRNESVPKRHTVFNQRSSEMDVTNISEEQSHHPVVADNRGFQKNRQTNIFLENNELDITNSSTNECLQIPRPYQELQNIELDLINNRKDNTIQHADIIIENKKLQSVNSSKRKTIFYNDNIDIDPNTCQDVSNISFDKSLTTDSKSKSLSCFPNQSQNLSIDETSYTEVINTLRPRKFSQNQSQRIDKSAIKERHAILQKNICMNVFDCGPIQNIPNNNNMHDTNKGEKFIERNLSSKTNVAQVNDIRILANLSQDQPRSLIPERNKSEENRHTRFFLENNDLDITNISEECQQHIITNLRKEEVELQVNRQTNLFENNGIESEKKRDTIFFPRNNDLNVTNISHELPVHTAAAITDNKRTRKYRPTIVFQNIDLDVTKIADKQEIKENILPNSSNKRQTILFQDNNQLDITDFIDKESSYSSHPQRRKTVVFENRELDLTNIEVDISNENIHGSNKNNANENLLSNQFLKRKMIYSNQTNDLDLSDVPKKTKHISSDNYNQSYDGPDSLSNKNMEISNISSQDLAFDINLNHSNISIKLSTPVKNPNNINTLCGAGRTSLPRVLSSENNNLNIGDLTVNIGMKKMNNTSQNHENQSDIDFSIVYSPRGKNLKKEWNVRKDTPEKSNRKTLMFDCDNDLDITKKNTELIKTGPGDMSMRQFKDNESSSKEFTPNCTRDVCRHDVSSFSKEEQNVSNVFDKIRKSFGRLSLSLNDDDIENTRFSLIDDITVNGSFTENLLKNANDQYLHMNEATMLNQSINEKKPVLEQHYCKKCEKIVDPNETSLYGFTLDKSNEQLELDLSGYERFQDMPTIEEVIYFHKKKRDKMYEWYYSEINAEESIYLPSTPSLKFLYENYAEELYKKTLDELIPEEIEPIFPLIPSVEFLLKNKFKNEDLRWKINALHLPAGILEIRHKAIRTCCFQFIFKKENYGETYEKSINFDQVLFKECAFYENWTARDSFMHNELSLKLPRNLTPSCLSSIQLFTFLEEMNKIFENVIQLLRELMLILIDSHATLEKDESNHCFIRKLVRKNLSTYQEIFIRINDASKLSYSNVGLRPGPLICNENINSLPAGLQFVEQFLKEPSKFIKLF